METAKTGKVTTAQWLWRWAFLVKKDASFEALITEMRSIFVKRQKDPTSWGKFPQTETFLKNQEKARYQWNQHLNKRS
jgi:hypothetical protein